ncbi:MAG: hypothetical protein ABFD86_15300, partial [Bryobacteraceae bacterium]
VTPLGGGAAGLEVELAHFLLLFHRAFTAAGIMSASETGLSWAEVSAACELAILIAMASSPVRARIALA